MRRMGLMPDASCRGSWVPDKARRQRLIPTLAAVVQVLTTEPGLGVRKIRAAVRSLLGRCADADTDAALHMLGPAILRTVGAHGAHRYVVDMAKVPRDVLAHFAASDGGHSAAPTQPGRAQGP